VASILTAANIVKENPARRVMVYAFAVGILLLIVSIITFCWIAVSASSYSSFDWRKRFGSSFRLERRHRHIHVSVCTVSIRLQLIAD
jgi:hypothetical protein